MYSRRYQAQVALLSSLLRPTYGYALEIGTVDGMQGREKDAVVISLVRSNEKVGHPFHLVAPAHNDTKQREVGFLKDKRRMNGVSLQLILRRWCLIVASQWQ